MNFSQQMQFYDYFESLGFTHKEASIYLALYKLGTQPASVIAKYVDIERTYVYKVLTNLAQKNIVSITERNGVKHFFIPDISMLKRYVKNERTKYEKMHDGFASIEVELQSYKL